VNIDLFGPLEGQDFIREKARSRDWWLIVNGDDLNVIVEERYYSDEHSHLLELIVVPSRPLLSIAFAHKSRMSAEQLADCAIEAGATSDRDELAHALETQDVLFPSDNPLLSIVAMEALLTLLGPDA